MSLFVGAALAPALHRAVGRRLGLLLALLPLGTLVLAARALPIILEGGTHRESYRWIPSLGITCAIALDGLALVFLALICGVGALIFVYASEYLRADPKLGRFFAYLLVFTGSMAGLVLADDMFFLFVCWELTSVSSYLLIAWDYERPEARKAALTALLVTGAGGLALLAGLVQLAIVGGGAQLSHIAPDVVQKSPMYKAILVLVLAGAFTKSAQVPFHFWLPRAMEAPAPISAYLHSATMVKAGVYLLARLDATLGGTRTWGAALTIVGTSTMIAGVTLAIAHKDLKRILAYSTVSVLGLLTMLLGIGTQAAVSAAVVYLIAHSLYKAALFLVAGNLDHHAGSRDITELRGLARLMPITAAAAALAGASNAGLPPLMGFLAKELLYGAVLEAPWAARVLSLAAVGSSVLFVVVSMMVAWRPFFGGAPLAPSTPHEAPPSLWLGPLTLAVLSLVLGVAPQLLGGLPSAAAAAILERPVRFDLHLWHGLTPVLGLTAITILSGVAVARASLFRAGRVHRTAQRIEASAHAAFDGALTGLIELAERVTRLLQTGQLRHYLLVTIGTTIVLVGLPLLWCLPQSAALSLRDVELPEVVLAAVIITAALTATRTPSRLAAVAALGALGISVMLVFVIFSALDLALTQILVEVLTVVIFVLVLRHMPRFSPRPPRHVWLTDALVSAVFGGMVALLILVSGALSPESVLSDYFVSNAYSEAHGRNIVNVILVDFRATDTLGETTVLCVAGIGVYALSIGAQSSAARAMPSVILRAVTPVLMLLLILVSIYAVLRGHNEPGGGFVGGLLMASAFSLHVLAFDVRSTRLLLGVSPRALMGIGLSVILLSGSLGLVAGRAFLEGIWVTVPIPGLGDVAVGTPVLFDIGVDLAVMGMVLTIVLRTAEMNP